MAKEQWRRKKTESELRSALNRQIKHLKKSASDYHRGDYHEAERLATVVYTLLHDGSGRTKSLLGQLCLKNKLMFPCASSQFPWALLSKLDVSEDRLKSGKTIMFCPPLVHLHHHASDENMIAYPKFMISPLFLAHITRKNFDDWWLSPAHFTSDGQILTRQKLVFNLRTTDGGSHFDGEVFDKIYDGLANDMHPSIRYTTDDKPLHGVPVRNGHWAAMRQIAWEVDHALRPVEMRWTPALTGDFRRVGVASSVD